MHGRHSRIIWTRLQPFKVTMQEICLKISSHNAFLMPFATAYPELIEVNVGTDGERADAKELLVGDVMVELSAVGLPAKSTIR